MVGSIFTHNSLKSLQGVALLKLNIHANSFIRVFHCSVYFIKYVLNFGIKSSESFTKYKFDIKH